ncbi:MAG TPA: OmpA family protein [Steroidobacteraceae bacterium]|nr:OmpA family protein [Steroidobacteraceae bacterium]
MGRVNTSVRLAMGLGAVVLVSLPALAQQEVTVTAPSVNPAPAADAAPAKPDAGKPARKSASKEENIGFFSGVAIGAVAGGPIGAVAGGIAGALLGDHYHQQKARNQALAADLAQSDAARAQLAQSLTSLDGSLQLSEADRSKLSLALRQVRDLSTDVKFRTDEADLTGAQQEQIMHFGALAAQLPDVQVRVSGYADPRGPAQYNQELSQARADAVAAALLAAGVPAERIAIEAHGASDAADGSPDDYALERHVSVQLLGPQGEKVAAN